MSEAKPSHGQSLARLRLPSLRRGQQPLVRQMRLLRRVEFDHRGAAPTGSPGLIAIKGGKGRLAALETLSAATSEAPRLPTGIAEFDRVLGGGLVPGSAVSSPAIPASANRPCCFRRRPRLPSRCGCRLSFRRGGAGADPHAGGAPWALRRACRPRSRDQSRQHRSDLGARDTPCPRRHRLGADAVVGGRRSRARHHLPAQGLRVGLDRPRQGERLGLILIGHVTKDGQIAGPKVIEHMVDSVLSFEV